MSIIRALGRLTLRGLRRRRKGPGTPVPDPNPYSPSLDFSDARNAFLASSF